MALYRMHASGMGAGHLPDPGGVNDQASWLIDAFAVIGNHEAKKGRGK